MIDWDRLETVRDGTGLEQIFAFGVADAADWPLLAVRANDMLIIRRTADATHEGDVYLVRRGGANAMATLREKNGARFFEWPGADPVAETECEVWGHLLSVIRRGETNAA